VPGRDDGDDDAPSPTRFCEDQLVRSLSLHTSDGQALAADIAEAEGPAIGAVVICHPHPLYGGNRFNVVVDALFTALPRAGFTTIRFDFRAVHADGVGERLDVVAALDAVAGTDLPLFVAGYSFGGLVALTTDDARIAAIVAVAAPLSPAVVAPKVPTLLLVPRHDQYCPPETATALVSTWAHAELDVVEDADHFLAGRTTWVAERTVAWLTDRHHDGPPT
jgi:alpha/beta superfamily hydrolase